MAVFGNVWLYSAAAFVIGVVLTWLFWVMPLQRRLHAVQRELRSRMVAPAVAAPEPTTEPPALDELLGYPDDQDDPALTGHGVGIGGTGLFVASRTGLEQAPAPGARHDTTQELPVPESWQPADLADDEGYPERRVPEFGASYGTDGYPSIAETLGPGRTDGAAEAAAATTVFQPFADAGEDYGREPEGSCGPSDPWAGGADVGDDRQDPGEPAATATELAPAPRPVPDPSQHDSAYLAFLSQQYEDSGDTEAAMSEEPEPEPEPAADAVAVSFPAGDLPPDDLLAAGLPEDPADAADLAAEGLPAGVFPGDDLAADGVDTLDEPADPAGTESRTGLLRGASIGEAFPNGRQAEPVSSGDPAAGSQERSLFEPVVDTGLPLDDDLPDPRRLRAQQGDLDLEAMADVNDTPDDAAAAAGSVAEDVADVAATESEADGELAVAADLAADEAREDGGGEEDGVPPGPFGRGSALPQPDGGPPSPAFTVKARTSSMVFHTSTSPFYDRLLPQVWFRTAADARRAGFTSWERPKS